jgi:adenosylhomocysteine nucleosidase
MTNETNIGAYADNHGTVNVHGNVAGRVDRHEAPGRSRAGSSTRRRADVGILTVLTEELVAVVEQLERYRNYQSVQLPGGVQAHVAEVPADDGRALRVAAMQTLDRGPRSATVAFERLQKVFGPSVVLLVGIAGGIRRDLAIGDVVIADEVVYYDARREAADGPHRRGQSQPMTAALRHRLHEFFRRYGDAVPLGGDDSVPVRRGPIGSGDAVVTDSGSDILDFLRRFNEKTLAVETEAAGVGQAFYEYLDRERALHGWLTIRGISDLADRAKGHDRHRFAAQRAALVMDRLLPLLRLEETP